MAESITFTLRIPNQRNTLCFESGESHTKGKIVFLYGKGFSSVLEGDQFYLVTCADSNIMKSQRTMWPVIAVLSMLAASDCRSPLALSFSPKAKHSRITIKFPIVSPFRFTSFMSNFSCSY